MNNQGWVKLHRKLKKTSFYNKPYILWLFIHLLLSANHETRKIIFNGEELTVKEGQLITGRREIASHGALSEMQVRYGLKCLFLTNTITIKVTNKFSVITICNWKSYQESNQQFIQPTTNKQPTDNQQTTTNNKDKKDNKYIYTLNNQNLSYADLYVIAVKKDVVPADVIKKYFEIVDRVNAREFKKQWGKDMKLLLPNWIKRDIEDGKIEPMGDFEHLIIKDYAPGKKRGEDLWARALQARKSGQL